MESESVELTKLYKYWKGSISTECHVCVFVRARVYIIHTQYIIVYIDSISKRSQDKAAVKNLGIGGPWDFCVLQV